MILYIWTRMTEPTQQEKIKEIYEVMADKTLSFGCIVSPLWRVHKKPLLYLWTNDRCWYYWTPITNREKYIRKDFPDLEEIWHPIRIWDVLDWTRQYTKTSEIYFYQEKMILAIWKDKRSHLPLGWWKEREEVVTYLYSNMGLWQI